MFISRTRAKTISSITCGRHRQASKPAGGEAAFPGARTDLVVGDVMELGQAVGRPNGKRRRHRRPPRPKANSARIRPFETNPSARPTGDLREGDQGYDPAAPDKVYSGWQDAYWNQPRSRRAERRTRRDHAGPNRTKSFHATSKPLMRVDLSSIPSRANILAAKLFNRPSKTPEAARSPNKPNHVGCRALQSPWNEYEVNAYQFARDRY